MRLAVVIPVFNERDLLPRLLERLEGVAPARVPGAAEALERVIVVVDDCSTDGTRDVVRALGSRAGFVVVEHERNQGKGAAVRSGFAAALKAGADVVLIQDADLEYDPKDHARVLEPILDGRADAVIGSRFLGETHRVLYFWHFVANRVITLASNALSNLNLSDIECCFKAMTREVLERVVIEEERFGVEPELVAKLARVRVRAEGMGGTGGAGGSGNACGVGDGGGKVRWRRARVYEVAVSYAGRTYEEGKKIGWKDAVRALWCIGKYNVWKRGKE